ncbi:hypothetical protein G3578_09975 [Brevibacillus sp. SYP-B805]|uniref:hypothetical protein n=1 Tax=Brevibacillus sp. SYP-B805 TaxID=1578199 RepID=UPI0013EC6727|nr:hypothetical protein [Brevibacillus sp. SYP-B805]NGQ95479.1 hypothetical protein [Brevibacillus sp. SYP-B805]
MEYKKCYLIEYGQNKMQLVFAYDSEQALTLFFQKERERKEVEGRRYNKPPGNLTIREIGEEKDIIRAEDR